MKKGTHISEHYELCLLLEQANDVVLKIRKSELEELNISIARATTLIVTKALGTGATTAEVSRWLVRRPHSVSELLGRMEKDGLVTKFTKSEGKRRITFELTDKGKEAYDKLIGPTCHEILCCLSDKDLHQLRSSLRTIRDEAFKYLAVELKPPFP